MFADLTQAHLDGEKKRIERIVSELSKRCPQGVVETVLVGMELVEHEPVHDKKKLLLNCLDGTFEHQLVDNLIEAIVSASRGQLDINRPPEKRGCFTGRP
jgi:hypothetical protein